MQPVLRLCILTLILFSQHFIHGLALQNSWTRSNLIATRYVELVLHIILSSRSCWLEILGILNPDSRKVCSCKRQLYDIILLSFLDTISHHYMEKIHQMNFKKGKQGDISVKSVFALYLILDLSLGWHDIK